MAKVAVEEGLKDIQQFLQSNGHEVVSLENGNTDQCDCCIISGMDKDVMGIQNRAVDAPVINVHGMNYEEIIHEVQKRSRH